MLGSKKLSTLLENRDLTVIKRPQNLSFLRSISDSLKFEPKSFSRSESGAKLGT